MLKKIKVLNKTIKEYNKCFFINLVFSAEKSGHYINNCLKNFSSEYREVSVLGNEDEWEDYYDSLSMKVTEKLKNGLHGIEIKSNLSIDKQPAKKFILNYENFIDYIDKFEVFVFRDYIEKNIVTQAILEQLNSKSIDDAVFLRLLKALNIFWD